MKKVTILMFSLVMTGLLMSSCGNVKECPAYSQADQVILQPDMA